MKITSIQQQVKRADRYSLYVDGVYAFSLSEAALLESRLVSGQELTPAQLVDYKKLSADDKAYGNALRYVLMRPRSLGEMHDYFRRKKLEEPVAAKIITRLSGLGLLDDVAFARSWVDNRRLLKPTSRRKLTLELKQKRVAQDIIDTILQEDREQTDERSVLRQLIARKRSRYADQQKLMAYLARQGYAFDDIKAVLAEPID